MLKKYILGTLGIAFALTGCVSTKTYRIAQDDTAACLKEKQALSQQVDALNKEKTDLTQAAAEKDTEISKLKATYDELVGNLKNEISSGQIQVTQLRDKLTL